MIKFKNIDDIAARLGELLPPGAEQARADIEAQIRSVLTRAFEKMELVTREEFDAQTRVLERAQVKLAALESQLDALEAN